MTTLRHKTDVLKARNKAAALNIFCDDVFLVSGCAGLKILDFGLAEFFKTKTNLTSYMTIQVYISIPDYYRD